MSERIRMKDKSIDEAVRQASAVLADGGVVMYPTDTLYGLGADAFSDEAVDKVTAIKGRDQRKPIHCIVADIAMGETYAEFSDDARLLAKTFFPGALTLVLPKRPAYSHGIGRYRSTIGIRIPDNDFCLALAHEFGRPFTTTSANKAGEPHAPSVDGILEQLGTLASRIALVVDAGDIFPRMASTVVDLSREEPVILREGAIAAADIWNTLRSDP